MNGHWRFFSGKVVPDLGRAVRDLVGDEDLVLHVGTDSMCRREGTDFASAVVVVAPGRGGRIFYRCRREPKMSSLAQRLIREAELSLEVALHLSALLPQEIVLHIDANQDLRHRSAKYVQTLAGMGRGYGFQVRLKPDAWCATHVADHVVKERHQRAA